MRNIPSCFCGGYSSVGRALDCDSSCRGLGPVGRRFESSLADQFNRKAYSFEWAFLLLLLYILFYVIRGTSQYHETNTNTAQPPKESVANISREPNVKLCQDGNMARYILSSYRYTVAVIIEK